jgi:hypothetical protein
MFTYRGGGGSGLYLPAVVLEQMRRAPPNERALLALLGVDEKAPWEEVRRAFARRSEPAIPICMQATQTPNNA